MKDQIKLTIKDYGELNTKKGITIIDLIKILGVKEDVIAASTDGNIVELNNTLEEDASIDFIKINEKIGGKIYRAGLQFVYIVAVKELFGKKANVKIKHSIDKGIYTEIEGVKLNKEKVNKIKEKMKEIISSDIKIDKIGIPRVKAIKYFEDEKELEKVKLYNQMTSEYVIFYELLGYYNYFYYFLPSSTGILKIFDLTYVKPNAIVLMYPKGKDNKIPPYHNMESVLKVFKNYSLKMDKIGINYACDINELISLSKIDEFVQINEKIQDDEFTKIVEKIKSKKNIKLVLVGGPSSSGKTTTSKKIELLLKRYGIKPFVISLDNYFKNRVETPKDENGNYDFEKIEAIDIELFNKQLSDLISYKEVLMPEFNFITGEKEYKGNPVKLEKGQIIIIEGLHTLNEKLTSSISRKNKFKIYASPFTPLEMDRHNHISSTDLRLIRRIVRDSSTRGYDAEDTLNNWRNMRESEEKYVFPYQTEADAVVNTALFYEINALKVYVDPLLHSVPRESKNYEEAIRLINFMNNFFCMPDDSIPSTSVLREFIGNSYFN